VELSAASSRHSWWIGLTRSEVFVAIFADLYLSISNTQGIVVRLGEENLPFSLGKTTTEFLKELGEKLDIARHYAEQHSQSVQNQYISRYNLRSRDKQFSIGEKCLVLVADTTASKVFSRWQTGIVLEQKSAYSYVVETENGKRHHLHANKIRKFRIQVDEVTYNFANVCNHKVSACYNCSIVFDDDDDFGPVEVVEPPLETEPSEIKPSQKISHEALQHLSEKQRREWLSLLDEFSDCFSETPGLCPLVEHEIQVNSDFKPKRLPEYRIPDNLKPEVDGQVNELLKLGFIKPSKTPMASPVVPVLKGPNGQDGVRIAVNYQYVNKYT
jgi:hypothetical protein